VSSLHQAVSFLSHFSAIMNHSLPFLQLFLLAGSSDKWEGGDFLSVGDTCPPSHDSCRIRGRRPEELQGRHCLKHEEPSESMHQSRSTRYLRVFRVRAFPLSCGEKRFEHHGVSWVLGWSPEPLSLEK
jgi:hypothetical protein